MRRCSNAASAFASPGKEKTNVEEYCVSEGWIRVAAGKALDRKGKPLTIKLKGPVEAYFRGEPAPPLREIARAVTRHEL